MQQKLNQNRSAVRINPKLQSRSALTVTSEAPATRRGRNKLMGPQLQLSKTDAPRRQRTPKSRCNYPPTCLKGYEKYKNLKNRNQVTLDYSFYGW